MLLISCTAIGRVFKNITQQVCIVNDDETEYRVTDLSGNL